MDQNLTIRQLAAATNLSRGQIDQWISRGYFKPKHSAEVGKARAFTIRDAVALGAFAELVRIGLPPAVASRHVHNTSAFTDDDALLVVTQGPIEIATSPSDGTTRTFYDPDNPGIQAHVIRARELIEFATDPNVRSMAVVNLNEVEKRVLKAIGTA